MMEVGRYIIYGTYRLKGLKVERHGLGLPPTQDASHHQDDRTFLGSGIPT